MKWKENIQKSKKKHRLIIITVYKCLAFPQAKLFELNFNTQVMRRCIKSETTNHPMNIPVKLPAILMIKPSIPASFCDKLN